MTLRLTCSASAAAMALGLAAAALTAPTIASAQFSIGFSVNIAPPLIPIFAQPPIPGYGYIWTPGYWAWDPGFGYYWVPGEWVRPPRLGLYWTPGYWAWRDGVYGFIGGYWGSSVGYYGGVDYGYGYGGLGYQGGEWRGGRLYYNRAANNFGGARIATVFSRPLAPRTSSRVSFNGGQGGLTVRPTATEISASRAPHVQPTAMQVQRVHAAAVNPAFRSATVVHGGASAAVAAMHRDTLRATGGTAAEAGTRAGAPATGGRPTAAGATAGRQTMTRPERGAAMQTTHTAPIGPQHMETGRPVQQRETGRTPSNSGGEARPNRPASSAMAPQREMSPPREMAPQREMAPRSQGAPRSEGRPSGGPGAMGRPPGGDSMQQGHAAPAREPAAKPESGGHPSAPPKGDEKNHPPG